jgi:hypothetical protein
MDKGIAKNYIRTNFRDEDRLAVVFVHKRSGHVTQRIGTAERIASDPFQAWLRYMNREKNEVYIAMNVLKPEAHGRTKADITEIRHIYLDFDYAGDEAIKALKERDDLPPPNHIIMSSPGRYQAVWRVEGFGQGQAEALMRGMVRELGADPAATDSSRVMRLPGFYNHKRATPHFVTIQNLNDNIYRPEQFPEMTADDLARLITRAQSVEVLGRHPGTPETQSERDWRFALRSIGRGEDPDAVIRDIEAYRHDKANPGYYARHTVEKALAVLGTSPSSRPTDDPQKRGR